MKKAFKIGVCLKADSNPFWSVDVRQGLEEAAHLFRDVRLFYRTPEFISEVSEQRRIINDFIRDGMDAIILAPSDPIRLTSAVQRVNNAGIPLGIIDSRLDATAVKKEKLKFWFLGFDDYLGGVKTGKLFIKHLVKGSPVAVIHGSEVGSYVNRVKGFCEAVKGYLQIKAVVSANFEEDQAYQATKKLIKQFPSLQAIFCTSDNMAMGCLTALFEVNRNDVAVSGFDGTHVGRLAVQKGRLLSTVWTNPEVMGREAIRLMRAVLLGKKISPERQLPIKLLTRESSVLLPRREVKQGRYTILRAQPRLQEFDYTKTAQRAVCPIIIGTNYLKEIPPRLKALQADQYVLVTDSVVNKLYGQHLFHALQKAKLNTELFTIPPGEHQKIFTVLNDLATRILDHGISKRTCLVLVGGGVVGNLAGFLSAILMRGIRFVHIPTTVMSQLDSTTGGKQAVNTEHGKNLLGTFHEPEFIYIDTGFVQTLSRRDYQSGMAEAIKHGLCQSKKLLALIADHEYEQVLMETIRLKTHLIDLDPHERQEGVVLTYGHTIGHALETVSNHTLNHGEAISLGMIAAARLSFALKYCDETLVKFHETVLRTQRLPTQIPKTLDIEEVLKVLSYDKKERLKLIPFALLEDVERVKKQNGCFLIPVNTQLVRRVLRGMQGR